jgi:hypothetical protein
LRPLAGPDKRVRYRGRGAFFEPFRKGSPGGTRIALVNRRLSVTLDPPQPVPQVVLHIRNQIADAVVERDLPAGGTFAEVIGLQLRRFEPGDHGRCPGRVLKRRQFGLQGQTEVVRDGEEVLAH